MPSSHFEIALSSEPTNGHTSITTPQFSQPVADKWLCQQTLEREHKALQREFMQMANPATERAVTKIDFSPLVRPTQETLYHSPNPIHESSGSLFSTAPLDDLHFNLRNFLTVNPVEDPNTLYARIAVKESRATPGHLPPFPLFTSEPMNNIIRPLHFSQPYADQWLSQQTLEQEYGLLKVRSMQVVDQVAERAVTKMDFSRFPLAREALSRSSSPTHKNIGPFLPTSAQSEDLNFSLRNFLVADPVDDPNVLYARIAVKEGAIPGYVPPLPPPTNEDGSCKAYRGSP